MCRHVSQAGSRRCLPMLHTSTYERGSRCSRSTAPSWSVPSKSIYWPNKTSRPSRGDAHGTAAHESDWLLQAAADRLRQFGVPPSEIARLEQTGTVQHDVSIDSPASGYITEFNALPNQYVQAETKLYTIADLSTVWVNANVFQTDVGTAEAWNARHDNG